MTFWVWMEVVCGKCAAVDAGQHAVGSRAASTATKLQKQALAKGWKLVGFGHEQTEEWACPKCQGLHEKEPTR